MHKRKRTGVILILIGVLVPLLLLLFTSNYNPDAGFFFNILHLEIVIKVWGRTGIAVPYRFPLAACIFLLFLGIRAIEQAKGEGEEKDR